MATINAEINTRTAFAGGADEIVCAPVAGFRKGVQIAVEGFTLDGATITAKSLKAADYDAVAMTDAVHAATIGDELNPVGGVKLSGLAGGSYFVTFTDLRHVPLI